MANKIIDIDPEIPVGVPLFHFTQVPVKNLFDYIEAGKTIDIFLADFPSVTRGQALAVVSKAHLLIDEYAKRIAQNPSVAHIKAAVCRYFHLSVDSLELRTRKKEVAQARQVVMYFARNLAKLSFVEVAAQCGKNHATAIYSCKKIVWHMKTDETFNASMSVIENEINEECGKSFI